MVSWLLATAMVMTCVPMNISASDFGEESADTVFLWEEGVESEEEASADIFVDTYEEPEIQSDGQTDSSENVQQEENAGAVLSEEETDGDEAGDKGITETEAAETDTTETDISENEISETEITDAESTETEIPEAAQEEETGAQTAEQDDFAGFVALADSGDVVEGYVLMNIPYNEFYKGEKSVDVVSAATTKKRSNQTLAGGSYHVGEDGSDITGVIFPVKLQEGVELSGEKYTKADTAEALFSGASYTYAAMNKIPAVYKELSSDGSFGPVQGTKTAAEASVELKLDDKHADYDLEISGLALAEGESVSGVVL